MAMMIETRGLHKAFGDYVMLDGTDLDVAAGTIFALPGPNGAGKTTTVSHQLQHVGAGRSKIHRSQVDISQLDEDRPEKNNL